MNEGNYLAHTQGKRHQKNLKIREARMKNIVSQQKIDQKLIENELFQTNTQSERNDRNDQSINKKQFQNNQITQWKGSKQNITQKEMKKNEMKPKKYKVYEKIGKPGYSVMKRIDEINGKKSIVITVDLSEIKKGIIPLFKVMSSFEQQKEEPDERYLYVIIAAEPYQSIAFKIPNEEIERNEENGKFGSDHWDFVTKTYTVTIVYK